MTVVIIIAALAAAYIITCGVLFCITCLRFDRIDPAVTLPEKVVERSRENYKWFLERSPQRLEIKSGDGLTLVGHYLRHPQARGTLVMFHGYRSSPERDFAFALDYYYKQHGLSLLLATQRAHGESGGKFICYGQKEKDDCVLWCRKAGELDPEHPIVLAGLSMGATTVMLACGQELPEQVKCAVADCGFTSPWEELCHVVKSTVKLKLRPLVFGVDLYARVFAGFTFRGESTVSALKRAKIPVLFIHGEGDNFVPTRFSHENYAAHPVEKALFTVPGATHGMSFPDDEEGYRRALEDFLEKYLR